VIPRELTAVIRLALDPITLLRVVLDPRTLRAGWKALRPPSLVIAGFSCLLGIVLGFRDGSRDWINAAAALVAGLCLQAGVNLVNDFFEFKQRKIDDKLAHLRIFGDERERVEWLIFCAGLLVMAAAGPIGLFIAWRTHWGVVILGLVGFAGGFFYTGEPLNYKRRGLAVPIVFFLMGMFMIAGSYFAVRRTLTWDSIWVSIPVSTLVSLILLANELRDFEADSRHGIRTLTVRIGYRPALALFFALLAAAYAVSAVLAVCGLMPSLRLIFFALPFAVPPAVVAFREPSRRMVIIPLMMLHHLVFGGLFALTYVLG
jgi:1,4-dihydroxy-2-naphthoate polyprenyltransferase